MASKPKPYTQMLGRAHARMHANLIPQTDEAYEAIHELMALRRDGIFRPLIDRIEFRLEVWMFGLPSQERVNRGCDVLYTKARCLRAGISAEIIDDIFPERPNADEAQAWIDRVDYHCPNRFWRIHRFAEWQRHLAHMDGC